MLGSVVFHSVMRCAVFYMIFGLAWVGLACECAFAPDVDVGMGLLWHCACACAFAFVLHCLAWHCFSLRGFDVGSFVVMFL